MSERALEAIKGAILLEKRGQVLYRRIAGATDSEAVREVFTKMAEEEKHHEMILSRHYSSLVTEGKLAAITELGQTEDVTGTMLTDAIRNEIEAAGYEAAAISAAIALEKEAESYYSRKADEAETEIESRLYRWLSEWEHSHQELLAEMDRVLMEKVWFDNHFWPEI
jgi:rubrerythrin